jgi:hypothetical protein
MTATQPLKYLTKCRFCPKEFATSPFDIPIIGQPPNQRLMDYGNALMKHLGKAHPEKVAQLAGALQEFSYILCASHYDLHDPSLLAMRELIRARAHRFTRQNYITDETITDRLSKLPIPSDILEPLTALFQDMRDILAEDGRYAPTQQEKPLVTV